MIDFGISRALEKTTMTSTGMIVGTPSYMSPEQAEGTRVGVPSDVFSLGCVIVFAATGTGPFGHGPQASLLYRVVHSAPVITEVPGGLRGLAAGCLAKVPEDRPTLAELQAAIAAGRAPEEGDALASFWPVAVTGLIRSHQARLTTELREGPTGPSPAGGDGNRSAVAGELAGTAGHTARAAGATAPGATAPAAGVTAPPATVLAAGSGAPAGTTALAGITGPAVTAGPVPPGVAEAGAAEAETARLDAATVAAATPGAGPALPSDQVSGAGPGVTRRRLLLGLAVVTGAGLGGAGWALSQDNPPHHLRPGTARGPRLAARGVPAAAPPAAPPRRPARPRRARAANSGAIPPAAR